MDDIVGKAFDARLMRRLMPYLWAQRRALGVALTAAVALIGANLVGPLLIKVAVDRGILRGSVPVLTTAALLYLGTYGVIWAASAVQTWALSLAGERVLYHIRMDLFRHLQRLSLSYYNTQAAGRIISRLTGDVYSLQEFITSGTVSLIVDFLTLVGIAVVMIQMNARLSVYTIALMPIILILSTAFRVRSRAAYREVRRRVATVTASLAESISGVRVTKSFSRETENLRRFDALNRDTMEAYVYAGGIFSVFQPLIEVTAAVGVFLVLWVGGQSLLQAKAAGVSLSGAAAAGPAVLTPGDLLAFLAYVQRFFDPIRNLSQVYNTMQSAMTGAERIFQILDTEPEVREAPDARELPPVRGRVAFEEVRFGYGDVEVLHGITFVAEPGQTVAIVGPTGAGKSTIINLLSRMYDVTSGRITMDGIDIREVTFQSLRRQIGTVLQDSFLFSGTVRDNIKYGRPDASDEAMIATARAVNAHEFIRALPEGYDTQVEERGSRLSMGQRQLVSFARALLTDPAILILDEATSSVDAATELIIQEALARLLEGRTAFVIAHRLSTIREADIILVVDGGRIVEQGRHEELLARRGLYTRLHAMQFRDLEQSALSR
jgi:ATP-binding cassette subfamily B multidrug efflux pump